MSTKIIYYQNLFLLHFAISEFLQRNLDCEQYALIDTTNKPKNFFETQQLVNFKKQWFLHDSINLDDNTNVDLLTEFKTTVLFREDVLDTSLYSVLLGENL